MRLTMFLRPPQVKGADQARSEGVGVAQGERLNPVIKHLVLRIQQIVVEDAWLLEVREVVAAENGLLGGRSPIDAADVLIFILRQRQAVHQFARRDRLVDGMYLNRASAEELNCDVGIWLFG